MTERELIYVKTIAEEKSISKAATKLFVSQPSLSQCVAKLEQNLGTRLFNRTSYGLTLTYAGEKYVAAANNILKIYSDFEVEISHVNSLNKGRITIGLTYVLSSDLLPKILPIFKEKFPNIDVLIYEANTSDLAKKITTGEIDFAISHNHPRIALSAGLEEHCLLVRDPFVLVCAKDAEILKRTKIIEGRPFPAIDLKDCADQNFIMLHQGQRIRDITDYMLQNVQVSPKIMLTTRNCETAKKLSAKGLGITLLPKYYADIFSDHIPTQYCSIDHEDAYWTLSVMVQKDGYLSAASKKFIEILKV
ncbi:MAG: LysR family transcriptional regulator, partial [Anaerotignaceae bacterium]